MDWKLAIEVNREALLRLLAMLVGASGLAPGGAVNTLKRWQRRRVLDFLIPAEAAVRRLILVVARGMSVILREKRGFPSGGVSGGRGKRAPVFGLVDPIRRVGLRAKHPKGDGPRIISFDEPYVARDTREPLPDDLLDAAHLYQRLEALRRALEDLPAQARRLLRWQARCERARGEGRWVRVSPLRSGRPPGHRARWRHPVDEVLKDCHDLALYSLANPVEAG